jgi:hypothetical protein
MDGGRLGVREVDGALPVGHLGDELRLVRDAAVEALGDHDADFDLHHVEPSEKVVQTFRMPLDVVHAFKAEAAAGGRDATAHVIRVMDGYQRYYGLPRAIVEKLEEVRRGLGMDRFEYFQHVLYGRSEAVQTQGPGFDWPDSGKRKTLGEPIMGRKRGLVLTQNDPQLLAIVGMARYLSTPQVQRRRPGGDTALSAGREGWSAGRGGPPMTSPKRRMVLC